MHSSLDVKRISLKLASKKNHWVRLYWLVFNSTSLTMDGTLTCPVYRRLTYYIKNFIRSQGHQTLSWDGHKEQGPSCTNPDFIPS